MEGMVKEGNNDPNWSFSKQVKFIEVSDTFFMCVLDLTLQLPVAV